MTHVWGHRGASGHAPENTLDAFAAAMKVGAAGIELDVHLSADGRVVVIHDDTLDRTCGVPGTVAAMAAADLVSTSAANGMKAFPDARIPLLDEVFDLVAGTSTIVNIELKGQQPELPDTVHRIVRDRGASDCVVYSSFNHYHLRALQDLGAASPVGVLIDQPLFEPWEYVASLGAEALHPPYPLLALPGLVTQCHRRGIAVNVWTPDTPVQWEQARALGVDAVITNHPAAAVGVLS
ncbi:glycerophosphodiester phosphodiesterase [Propionicicella superfundia]|uniref:glycerophosphodiester phosphodiesterase n=1 Tax=Propionicicella superfundia TaxID=348582 RepID=UPI0004100C69|nr:glycerophosphodiester phosphodiesterase family protein [Propionicicella superfundia]